MGNLLEQTDTFVKSKNKRFEKLSGKLPSKLRFTAKTGASLKYNIEHQLIEKAIARLNTVYSEMISAVEIAEKVKAEEEVRSKISGNAELEAKLETDKTVADITSEAIVLDRIKKTKIELLKLAGRIGTYKNNYGINVKKGFTPKSAKAISVQKLYADVYKSIENKIDLYRIASQKGVDAKTGKIVSKGADVPSWRKLFNDIKATPADLTVAMTRTREYDDEEKEFVPTSTRGVSAEDLSYRKMLSQLGDEFQLIEDYEKSPSGVPLQFKDGFESRKNNLSKIFFDLTGIEPSNKEKRVDVDLRDNTEFQQLIDDINGYKPPVDEKTHKEMEESLNEYYSRPEVTEKIDELKEKDTLFTFNQHMDDVIKAESLQNEQTANVSIKESAIETEESAEELEKERTLAQLKQGAEETARMLHSLNNYIDMRDKFEAEKKAQEEKERREMLESAEYEARRIQANNEYIDICESANYAAHKIMEEKEHADILASADFEAQRLLENNQLSDEEAKHKELVKGAEEQATLLFIKDSAEEEAKNIQAKNDYADICESALYAAKQIQSESNGKQNEIIKGAEEQATLLFIKDSAEEEAKNIQAKNDYADICESALYAAKQIQAEKDHNDILESANVAAHRIIEEKEHEDILEAANVAAKIIVNQNKKADLLSKAAELSEQLKNINEEADRIDGIIDKLDDKPEETNNVVQQAVQQEEPQKIIKMEDAFYDPEIINSADVEFEAERLLNNNRILDSADYAAHVILNNNMIADGAEEEARRLYENNQILDMAQLAAERIHERNLLIIGAEETARDILKKTMTKIMPVERTTASTGKDYELMSHADRYAELVNASKALLIKKSRIDNIEKRANSTSLIDYAQQQKEALTAFNAELAEA